MTRVLFVYRNEDEVVEDPLRWHVVVNDFRQHEAGERQKYPLRRIPEPRVLHRRGAHDRRGEEGVAGDGFGGEPPPREKIGRGGKDGVGDQTALPGEGGPPVLGSLSKRICPPP